MGFASTVLAGDIRDIEELFCDEPDHAFDLVQGAVIMLMPLARLRAALEANRRDETGKAEEWPVVRLFTPLGKSVWLLSQIDPNDKDKAFGLCDEGDGRPVLGQVSLEDLAHRFGHLSVRWDDKFQADRPLSAYTAEARQAGRIQS
ncbi:MAG: DUF2958 domain-containing protein [Pseudomonadota bacterium]